MFKLREALVEACITLIIGGLIGATVGVVANLFVIGVESLGAHREASSLFSVNFPACCFSGPQRPPCYLSKPA
ncbi:hypothetical protein N9X47_01975 [Porticoccaceae bacterium]|nr:hypothetical protein [Porticoccaceae bacterium]